MALRDSFYTIKNSSQHFITFSHNYRKSCRVYTRVFTDERKPKYVQAVFPCNQHKYSFPQHKCKTRTLGNVWTEN